jgi:hypothetical protein
MKEFIVFTLIGLAIVLILIFSPWANDWAQRQLDEEDRRCLVTGLTQAQCDYIQSQGGV